MTWISFLWFLFPLATLLWIGLFIFIIITIMKDKHLSLLNLYLLVISIVWIIWVAVGYWVLVYTQIETQLITDQEYLAQNYYGAYDYCETDTKPVTETGSTTTKSQEEIDKCKKDREESDITRRHLNNKEAMIWWWVWGSIFLILFATHFPLFLRKNKEVKENE